MRARVLSFLGWAVVSLWSRSIKIRFVNTHIQEQLKVKGKKCVYAFWHGNMFLLLHAHRNSGVLIPVSESEDGEIMAGVLERFQYQVVRGSSSRNGHKALLGMICGARKGETIGLAVDGPKGPLHEAKKGAIFLAGKLNMPIIPVATGARRSWVLNNTWEKLMLPVPFTEAVVMFGEPVIVDGTSEEAIESGRRKLEHALRNLSREAQGEAAWGGTPAHQQAYGT